MLLQVLRVSNLQLSHIGCFEHSYSGKEHGGRKEAAPTRRAPLCCAGGKRHESDQEQSRGERGVGEHRDVENERRPDGSG